MENRKMMVKVLFLSVIFIGIAFIGFALSIVFKKNGTFPNLHIGKNEGLRKKGIFCATTQDKLERTKVRKTQNYNRKTILDKVSEAL